MRRASPAPPRELLRGWAAVAGFLGVSPTKAQSWLAAGLPAWKILPGSPLRAEPGKVRAWAEATGRLLPSSPASTWSGPEPSPVAVVDDVEPERARPPPAPPRPSLPAGEPRRPPHRRRPAVAEPLEGPTCSVGGCLSPVAPPDRFCDEHRPVFEGRRRRSRLEARELLEELAWSAPAAESEEQSGPPVPPGYLGDLAPAAARVRAALDARVRRLDPGEVERYQAELLARPGGAMPRESIRTPLARRRRGAGLPGRAEGPRRAGRF